MENDAKKFNRLFEAVLLALIILLITLLHYSTMSGRNVLLHEISQRLYYIPIIYAAYSFGLKGSVVFSLLCSVIYIFHVSKHAQDPQSTIINQYAEALMFQAIGIVTGIIADAEKRQRKKFEKASADLSAAYKELQDTVSLLMRAARLKSLGEMAASIAHEIRNPLGAIKGAIEIVEQDIPPASPRREFVSVIKKEVDRLNRLVIEFLEFAKPRQPEKILFNLNELIKSVINFISPQAEKAGVKLLPSLDEELPTTQIDPDQIKQVLLNLTLNAIQASPGGGIVEIGSRSDGKTVEITFRDYGAGIEPDDRERVFEPFFTTKPDGSGLGLSTAYQLIKQHDGEIELVEQNGPGSLFSVRLPVIAAKSAKLTESVLKTSSSSS